MEKKRFVIDRKSLPSRMPLWTTGVSITVLHYWDAPQWLWGVFITITLITWLNYFYNRFFEEHRIDICNVLSYDKEEGIKPTLRDRMIKAIKQQER